MVLVTTSIWMNTFTRIVMAFECVTSHTNNMVSDKLKATELNPGLTYKKTPKVTHSKKPKVTHLKIHFLTFLGFIIILIFGQF